MRYTITGRNIDVTPGLRAAIEEKIGKLERYFLPDTEIIVTLSVQKDKQKIEVTIPVKGNIIRAEESSNDMYVSSTECSPSPNDIQESLLMNCPMRLIKWLRICALAVL